jgi:DNA-nicking Smr family endonuclease
LKKKNKNNLPVFDSNHDFLKEFERKSNKEKLDSENSIAQDRVLNKHGVKFLNETTDFQWDSSEQTNEDLFGENWSGENLSGGNGPGENSIEDMEEENFADLLEDSFKKSSSEKPKKKAAPMPLKKRLKRYPPVEAELDLHGFTATGAQVKAASFIHSCKQRGYFTLRIIVGKGLHSDLGPVLPDVVEDVLREMKKQGLVIFFEWDKKTKSKSGAVIVYLKQFEQYD